MKTQPSRYMGVVVSHKPEAGYAFIGIAGIVRDDGSPHGLSQQGVEADVFVHQDQCAVQLRVGLRLTFEIVPDAKRGEGHFRAQNAQEVIEAVASCLSLAVSPQAIARHPAHLGMKVIPRDQIALAVRNEPLKDIPGDEVEAIRVEVTDAQLRLMLATYLRRRYPGLHNLDLSFEVVGYDQDQQETLVLEALKACEALGMTDQVLETREAYRSFKVTRELLAWILAQGWLQSNAQITPGALENIVALFETLPSAQAKEAMVRDLQGVFGFMAKRGLLRANTAIPLRHLPELFIAAPVWFFALGSDQAAAAVKALGKSVTDPRVSQAVQFMCDLFPENSRWSDIFQAFNRRTRPIQTYKGDVIPTSVLRLIAEAREVFDHVVIMTPYLDIAGADWQDMKWLRSIDPYVVGFKKGSPVFFVLARFSDTGVFPLLHELVADTMSFLQTNADKLNGFNAVSNPYWYGRNGSHDPLGDLLIKRVHEMLAAYEQGRLFDWLRNEQSPSTSEVVRRAV